MSNVNLTYVDQFIKDGQSDTISLRNLFDTLLVGCDEHYFRIAMDDFFLKYRSQLSQIVKLYAVPETLFYQPKTISYMLYGTTELWLSLLRINNMRNISEFYQPIILVYDPSGLRELIDIFFKREGKRF